MSVLCLEKMFFFYYQYDDVRVQIIQINENKNRKLFWTTALQRGETNRWLLVQFYNMVHVCGIETMTTWLNLYQDWDKPNTLSSGNNF